MTDFLNKNDKQVYFNQVKGRLSELNDGEVFCNITIEVGHENPRSVNFVLKKREFDSLRKTYILGDRVTVRFYITSRFKNERWYTTATVLDVQRDFDKS